MRYQHIIFDIDGTLIDTEKAVIESFQKTLRECCQINSYSDEDLKFALGITGRDAIIKLGIEDVDGVLKVWNQNIAYYFHDTRPFDGIKECLESLKNLGLVLGIVTSKTKEEYDSEFSVFGFTNLFETSICADDTNKHKPNPEPLLKYLEKTMADKEKVLYIGDSSYDMRCAKSAGIDSALALWGCAVTPKPQATYYLKSPKDVLDLLYL